MATLRSTQIIIDALLNHIDATGDMQKDVAEKAGLQSNYFSMLKSGSSRVGLARVADLKRAMPGLDEPSLVSTILTEMYDKKEYTVAERENVQKALTSLINHYNQPTPLQAAMLAIVDEIYENEGKSGLPIPDDLPADLRAVVLGALKEAVQREAQAAYSDAHSQ